MCAKLLDEEDCVERRAGGPHWFKVDKEDRRFKICQYCKVIRYRTDEELTHGAEEVRDFDNS